MSMRKQFPVSVEAILARDDRAVVLLGDIGVFSFKKAFEMYPDRVYNIGILEQATIGAAAGLAMTGCIPVVHTIAPFLVERCTEQLKDDFGYQALGGNFVSVGASYDYAALGATHHCPGDVGILLSIPRMEIVLPGTASEFDRLLCQGYDNGHPTYYRLSERENNQGYEVTLGKAYVVQEGARATVIAVGPMLKPVLEACADQDVTILYYTTVRPFDRETLQQHVGSGRILLCEPYYVGGLTSQIMEAIHPQACRIDQVGIPRHFLTHYGTAEEHDQSIGITAPSIRERLLKLML